MARRLAFVAVLVYVTLDLSLPGMPGAFVFEPADSVESAGMSRWRAAADGIPLPGPSRNTPMSTPAVDDQDGRRSAVPVLRPVSRDAAGPRPRAALAPPSPSEDPL